MRSVSIFLIVFVAIASWVAIPSGFAGSDATPTSTEPEIPVPGSTPAFFPNTKITDGTSPYDWQVEPTMVVNESGQIFVGWKETDSPEAAGIRVGFSYSTDEGQFWAPNILMEQSHPDQGCHNSDPWLARGPDDRVHFAYLEYDCDSGITVSNTTNGEEWGTPHYLRGAGGLSDKESLAVDPNGRLYLAWDEAGRGNEMQVSWSDDDGATWAPFENPASSATLGVVVATSPNGTVYLTWWNLNADNIMFDWSSDGGTTWHPDVRVNSVSGSASGGGWQIPIPAMNVDPASGDIYIAWPDLRNGNQDIYLASSSDGGQTWSTNVRINDDSGSTTQYMVDLAIDSAGTVHAAWEDKRNGDWNIFYSNSTDGGQTWLPNLRVSSEDTPGTYNRPGDYFAIEAGPNDYIYVVWTDGRGEDFDIYYARSPGFPAALVTIATEPAGLPVIVDNVTATAPVQKAWAIGSVHHIEVASIIPIGSTSRYIWTTWSDGGDRAHTIVADLDRTITASFTKQYQSRVRPDPAGLTVLVDGIPITALSTFWWDDGSIHSIDAPSPQSISADDRYSWVSWSDGGARVREVKANAAVFLTATFIHEQSMRVSTSPDGLEFSVDGISYSTATTFWFEPNTDHIVSTPKSQTAPGTRYQFRDWSDGGIAAHTIAFIGPISLQARFSVQYYLSVTSRVPGASGSDWYAEGSIVVAGVRYADYATGPGERLVFLIWSGDAIGDGFTSDPILMDGPKDAIAEYGTQFYLAVSSSAAAATGSGWYGEGSTAEAVVSSTEVLRRTGVRDFFLGWSGDATGSAATSAAIAMDGPKRATALWQTQYFLQVESDVGTVEGRGWYPAGKTVEIHAPEQMSASGTNYRFAGWIGSVTTAETTLSITMGGPMTVRATWTPAGGVGGLGALSPAIFGLAVIGLVFALVVGRLVWRRFRQRD